MSGSTEASLQTLQENLGIKDTIDLLVFALPRIRERQQALHQCLQARDWEAASRVAHQTLSSVRLYGSSQIEQLLQAVRQQDIGVISSASFQQSLVQEFESVTHTVKTWLAKHAVCTQ